MKRIVAFGVLAAIAAFFTAVAPVVDRRMNRVHGQLGAPSARALALHRTLLIADLHDDVLLWPRDILDRSGRGHTDVPRLLEGGIGIQVFSTVTKTPRGMNYDQNTGETDNVTLLAIASRWPPRTWNSRLQRALHQARKLDRAAAASDGRLVVVRSSGELQRVLDERGTGKQVIAGILGTEGLHALDGRIESIDSLGMAGFRIFGLTHFFDNEVGGSAHGVSHGPLTDFGRGVVALLDSLGYIIDIAHASPGLVDDVLARSNRPPMVSHTGVRATCPGPRNLTDDQLRRISQKGGVIGIGFWDGAVCDDSPASIAKAIMHAVSVAGPEHVALGSDFDGATSTTFDASRLNVITSALLDAGASEDLIARVMGTNARDFLLRQLPAK